jgi:hypothetical protein
MKLPAFTTSALNGCKILYLLSDSRSVLDRAIHVPLSFVLSGAIRWEGTRNTYFKKPVITVRPVNLFLYIKMENVRSPHEFAIFEALREVTMKIQVLWDIKPCQLVNS